jgi:superoxide dismutase, Cu-Zn family
MRKNRTRTALLRTAGLVVGSVMALGVVQAAEPPVDGLTASADMLDRQGESIGTARLMQGPNGTLIRLDLTGLPPGFKAIHIHATGNCDDHEQGFEASGPHLNPEDKEHGLMNAAGPDAGDLANVYVHADGTAQAELFTMLATLDGSVGATILDEDGAALVMHENPDDHHSQPIGGAGDRIVCGVIRAD